MTIPHEPWLVLLSIAIAIQGSFVGLSLAAEIDAATGSRRRLLLAGSAVTLATGVWSMHFVGMLAASFPSAIDYLVLPTLTSFLICVIVVGFGVYAAHATRLPSVRIGVGRDRDGPRHVRHALCRHVGGASGGPDLSGAPIRRRLDCRRRSPRAASRCWRSAAAPPAPACSLGAVVLGLAISGMHYTAMAGMRLDPLCFDVSRFVEAEFGLVAQHAGAARDRDFVRRFGRFPAVARSGRRSRGTPRLIMDPKRWRPRRARDPDRRRRHGPPAAHRAPAPVPASYAYPGREGRPDARYRAVDDVYAVRANAHYTYIHDGESEYFCNRSISALEAATRPVRVRARASQLHRPARAGDAASADRAKPLSRNSANPCDARSRSRAASIATIKARIESLQRDERACQFVRSVSVTDAFRAKSSRFAPFSVGQLIDR